MRFRLSLAGAQHGLRITQRPAFKDVSEAQAEELAQCQSVSRAGEMTGVSMRHPRKQRTINVGIRAQADHVQDRIAEKALHLFEHGCGILQAVGE